MTKSQAAALIAAAVQAAKRANDDHKYQSCGLYLEDGSQLHQDLLFTRAEWENFMRAIVVFAAPEMQA